MRFVVMSQETRRIFVFVSVGAKSSACHHIQVDHKKPGDTMREFQVNEFQRNEAEGCALEGQRTKRSELTQPATEFQICAL